MQEECRNCRKHQQRIRELEAHLSYEKKQAILLYRALKAIFRLVWDKRLRFFRFLYLEELQTIDMTASVIRRFEGTHKLNQEKELKNKAVKEEDK